MARGSKNVEIPSAIINARRNVSAAFGGAVNSLRFPSDLGAHFAMFRFREYSATRNNRSASQGLRAGAARDRYTSSIILPLPINLQERFNVSYAQENLGVSGQLILDAASGISNLTGSAINNPEALGAWSADLGRYASSIAEQGVTSTAVDVAAAVFNQSFSRRLGPVNAPAVAQQLTGQINNPHTVTMFNGVQMRMHYFYWILTPESEAESRTIENITKRFKYHMLPEGTVNNYFLKYPDEVDITIAGASPEFQIPFKSAVVLSAYLDRSPSGAPVKMRDTGADAQVALSLYLMETETFVRDDIDMSNP